jgi:hypothetical protein
VGICNDWILLSGRDLFSSSSTSTTSSSDVSKKKPTQMRDDLKQARLIHQHRQDLHLVIMRKSAAALEDHLY